MDEQYFFLIFLTTILITRIVLFVKPVSSPTIKGFRVHYWMYGVLLITISIFIKNIYLLAIGLGLFVDELAYIFIGGKTHKDNYSFKSLIGTAIFIVIIYVFQRQILDLYLTLH